MSEDLYNIRRVFGEELQLLVFDLFSLDSERIRSLPIVSAIKSLRKVRHYSLAIHNPDSL